MPAKRDSEGETAAVVTAADAPVSVGENFQPQHTRIDTQFLRNQERKVLMKQAAEATTGLASVPATARKTELLAMIPSEPNSSSMANTLVDLMAVSSLLECTACRVCYGTVKVTKVKQHYRLAAELKMEYSNYLNDMQNGALLGSQRSLSAANRKPFDQSSLHMLYKAQDWDRQFWTTFVQILECRTEASTERHTSTT